MESLLPRMVRRMYRYIHAFRFKLFKLLSTLGWKICPEPEYSILSGSFGSFDMIKEKIKDLSDRALIIPNDQYLDLFRNKRVTVDNTLSKDSISVGDIVFVQSELSSLKNVRISARISKIQPGCGPSTPGSIKLSFIGLYDLSRI